MVGCSCAICTTIALLCIIEKINENIDVAAVLQIFPEYQIKHNFSSDMKHHFIKHEVSQNTVDFKDTTLEVLIVSR